MHQKHTTTTPLCLLDSQPDGCSAALHAVPLLELSSGYILQYTRFTAHLSSSSRQALSVLHTDALQAGQPVRGLARSKLQPWLLTARSPVVAACVRACLRTRTASCVLGEESSDCALPLPSPLTARP